MPAGLYGSTIPGREIRMGHREHARDQLREGESLRRSAAEGRLQIPMRRREFLILAGSAALAQTRKDDAKLERVCVSTWSFHTLFPNDSAKPAKPLDLLEFPEVIADRYHVHNVEVVAPHFASTESSYFSEFNARLKRAHSRLVNVPIDIAELWEKPSLSSPDAKVREHAISLYSKWIDRAGELGSPSVRCDPGTINLADLSPTIATYKTLW